MVSDDTEHACLAAQALIAAGDDVDGFACQLARRLRLWLLALPPGTGLATLKAAAKLCLGASPRHSGVFSAGNGPAMRSPVLGAAIDDRGLLQELVRASTRITHTDPKAEYGALAAALASRLASEGGPVDGKRYSEELRTLLGGNSADEILDLVERAIAAADRGESTEAFAASLGLERGVTGYVYHTVPVVVHAWLRHQDDFRSAVTSVIRCGGDTDSTAAITGGIIGCAVGRDGIPADWLQGLCEWPRTVAWMERLGTQLYEARTSRNATPPLHLPVYSVVPRNLVLLGVVLIHGFRRLFPPY